MPKKRILFDNTNWNEEEDYDWEWDCVKENAYGINTNTLICIADLGLWSGRKNGYRLLGTLLSNVFFVSGDCPYYRFYIDGHNDFRADQIHHDGTNYLLFREFKDNISDQQITNFCNKLISNKLTRADINRYTKSLGHYFS